jgi:hypothetical protein
MRQFDARLAERRRKRQWAVAVADLEAARITAAPDRCMMPLAAIAVSPAKFLSSPDWARTESRSNRFIAITAFVK